MKKHKRLIIAPIIVMAFIITLFVGKIKNADNKYLEKIEEIPYKLIQTNKEGIMPHGYINVFINRVVDGDTIKVKFKNKEYTVRFLCIDTPESVKQGVSIQPYGKEASNETKKLVLNKNAKLIFDKDVRDKYGRLLAHVILNNGSWLNALLIKNGFARVEIVHPNDTNEKYFYTLQNNAIK